MKTRAAAINRIVGAIALFGAMMPEAAEAAETFFDSAERIMRVTGIQSPGRRAMRALLASKQTVTIPVTHKDGNRATRRAALKTARTKQRQASRAREDRGFTPARYVCENCAGSHHG